MAIAMISGGLFAWLQIDSRNKRLDLTAAELNGTRNKLAEQKVANVQLAASLTDLQSKLASATSEIALDGAISEKTSLDLANSSRQAIADAERVRRNDGTTVLSTTINIDVFTCVGTGQAENAAEAKTILERLRTEQATPSGQLPFKVGRLRERDWTNRAELGGFIFADEVRGEPDEEALMVSLTNFINATPGPRVGKKTTSGKTPTPYYLSIFFCTGQPSG